MPTVEIAPVTLVESRIMVIRGQKVETKALNRAVRRNIDRFPEDFMFQLTLEEVEFLRCQFGTSKITDENRGGRRYLPYAFTEQGIAMLSGLLTSKRAVEVNLAIMRNFVRLHQLLATHDELVHRWTNWSGGRVSSPEPSEPKRAIGFPN